MKMSYIILVGALCCMAACSKPPAPVEASAAAPTPSPISSPIIPDAVERKLQEYSGSNAADCGRLDVKVDPDRSKAAADCALQNSQSKHPFYVAYDMPGMIVGVAGNSAGRLFSVQSEGAGAAAKLTSGDCPSELRVAASGRVTCFAPGDMGSLGGGHTAIPPGMPNPHAFPKAK